MSDVAFGTYPNGKCWILPVTSVLACLPLWIMAGNQQGMIFREKHNAPAPFFSTSQDRLLGIIEVIPLQLPL